MNRPKIALTNHAVKRWQQRIEAVSDAQAVIDMLTAILTAKPKHFRQFKLRKRTFYIPTARAIFVGSKGRIVTVLEPGAVPFVVEYANEHP